MGKARYNVIIRPAAREELRAFKVFEQRRITDAIAANLIHEPERETRHKKVLPGLVPSFEHDAPVRERVGSIRVFYDVKPAALEVDVRAIRRKVRGKTTEEITR